MTFPIRWCGVEREAEKRKKDERRHGGKEKRGRDGDRNGMQHATEYGNRPAEERRGERIWSKGWRARPRMRLVEDGRRRLQMTVCDYRDRDSVVVATSQSMFSVKYIHSMWYIIAAEFKVFNLMLALLCVRS